VGLSIGTEEANFNTPAGPNKSRNNEAVFEKRRQRKGGMDEKTKELSTHKKRRKETNNIWKEVEKVTQMAEARNTKFTGAIRQPSSCFLRCMERKGCSGGKEEGERTRKRERGG